MAQTPPETIFWNMLSVRQPATLDRIRGAISKAVKIPVKRF